MAICVVNHPNLGAPVFQLQINPSDIKENPNSMHINVKFSLAKLLTGLISRSPLPGFTRLATVKTLSASQKGKHMMYTWRLFCQSILFGCPRYASVKTLFASQKGSTCCTQTTLTQLKFIKAETFSLVFSCYSQAIRKHTNLSCCIHFSIIPCLGASVLQR